MLDATLAAGISSVPGLATYLWLASFEAEAVCALLFELKYRPAFLKKPILTGIGWTSAGGQPVRS